MVWAAILGASVVIAGMLHFGTDEESFRASLRSFLERMLRGGRAATPPVELPKGAESGRLIDFLVVALPPTAAVVTTITNLLNLWLASRIARISGRLRRPASDLATMQFPAYAPALIAVAIAASFVPGLIGSFGTVLTASLLMAYAILGLRRAARHHARHGEPAVRARRRSMRWCCSSAGRSCCCRCSGLPTPPSTFAAASPRRPRLTPSRQSLNLKNGEPPWK